MYKSIHLCCWLSLAFLLNACNQAVPFSDTGKLGTIYYFALECGWNSGNFEMHVNGVNTKFIDLHQTNQDTTITSTDTETWALLSSALDFEAFQKISLQSMDISWDGCDRTLRIWHGGQEHSIRYGESDSDAIEIEPVLPVIQILEAIRDQF